MGYDTDHGDNPLRVCMYTPLELLTLEAVTEALEWGLKLKCSSRRSFGFWAYLRDLDLDPIEVS